MENKNKITLPKLAYPLISIVIPMYNSEKYIGECLDSILSQTFQDFEVIVVDDCSTDKSAEIVKSYVPNFNGRLRLSRTKKNSGKPGEPRNVGISVSHGEYIYCLDSDDIITKTALEEMYTLAKENDADVVYCEKYFMSEGVGKDFEKNIRLADTKMQKPPFVDKPTLETNDLAERIEKWLATNYWMSSALRLVKRDLLIENNIKFPSLIGSEDDVWFLETLFCAKRFLRIPNACFVRRIHDGGISFGEYTTPDYVERWMTLAVCGLKELNDFMQEIEFFRERPDLCYAVFNHLLFRKFYMIYGRCKDLNPAELYKIFLEKFGDSLGEQDVLVSALCTRMHEQDRLLKQAPQKIKSPAVQAEPKYIVKHKNKFSAEDAPAVSVIVSLYNYEKYIGECLDSILNQTFQNFEVVVVDDCSTDKSFEVVESYLKKFDGRLALAKTEKNSGGGGVPRNAGLKISHGEYVFFMDADDVFTKTALEEMYNLAKEYDSEVVYCEKYFMSKGVGKDFLKKNIRPADENRVQKPPFVDKPTLETEDMAERTRMAVNRNYWMTPWLRLVKKNLLTENNITFDSLIGSNDVTWTFKVLFCAKKFLRVPNICYIRRIHDESVSFRKRTPSEYVHKWMDLSVRGLKDIDKFLDGIEFFKKNLKCRQDILNYLLKAGMQNSFKECWNSTKTEMYKFFRENFEENLGENAALIACFYAYAFNQSKWWDKRYKKLEEDFNRLKKENSRLKLKQGKSATESPSPQFNRPAISVVIPMFNAEEFIGECLDSLLIQTFQNFEVIVADDCSTDKSVAIVESYKEKFNGRLQITHTKKNSGGGGYIPRNLGLAFSCGEYVFFLDSDDFLLGNALETLYNAAKKYNTDVVYTAAYYRIKNPNDIVLHRDGMGRKFFKDGIKDKLTLTVDDTNELFKEFLLPGSGEGNFRAPWSKFCRRDFLIQNEILFPDIVTGGDMIWCINVYAHSKRFLRLPTPLYFYRRYNESSITRTARSAQEQLSYWVSAFIDWLKALNALQEKTDVLKENPHYCYDSIRIGHLEWVLNRTKEAREELGNQEVYRILYRELGKGHDSPEAATALFFSLIDSEKKVREDNLQTIKKLKKELETLKKKA